MSLEYLKKDFERVNKKFKELKRKGEIEAIEKNLDSFENKPVTDSMDDIWAEIYHDVLDLKKSKENKE
ncbi:hypothetical protein DSECCO2_186880 [anaerobic digester metagenome]|uniref:Antitoxin n=1 Tax=Methanobacterium subterraneum TaxID=59277 RepID=A0A2H4VDT9_9EURY|nr:hypothetical protein [Methanobacterium subterraneum]AUB56263.1 hypothetical protein BK007_09720 [Methanobacterium subterraneum]PKL73603.1 MAG: hypothetical protein CVV29_02645 [Methanobacteriales archaeon HGW-Methanobacteriales-2]